MFDLLLCVDESLLSLCNTFYNNFEQWVRHVGLGQSSAAEALSEKAFDIIADNFSSSKPMDTWDTTSFHINMDTNPTL